MLKKLLPYCPLIVLICLVTLAGSCDGDENGKDPMMNPTAPPDASLDVNLDKDLILEIINGHRSRGAVCGSSSKPRVPALEWSDELAKAALDHCNDMQARNYFSHTGANGSKFSERARNAGYMGFPVGENIANGQKTEEAVMMSWMGSAGHCSNIMNSNATEVGVARSDADSYWTMVLGKP